MSGLVSIDPGVRELGWARWYDSRLADVGVSIAREDLHPLVMLAEHHAEEIGPADQCAIEIMEMRPNDPRSHGAALLKAQLVAGLVAGAVASRDGQIYVATYAPTSWKSNVPKRIHHERIRAALEPWELEKAESLLRRVRKSNHKEAWDAIGIGLYHLGRIDSAGRKR